jgi:hypothetical protein
MALAAGQLSPARKRTSNDQLKHADTMKVYALLIETKLSGRVEAFEAC